MNASDFSLGGMPGQDTDTPKTWQTLYCYSCERDFTVPDHVNLVYCPSCKAACGWEEMLVDETAQVPQPEPEKPEWQIKAERRQQAEALQFAPLELDGNDINRLIEAVKVAATDALNRSQTAKTELEKFRGEQDARGLMATVAKLTNEKRRRDAIAASRLEQIQQGVLG